MHKLISRTVTFLLVPSLMMDPAFASAITPSPAAPTSTNMLFMREAIPARLRQFMHEAELDTEFLAAEQMRMEAARSGLFGPPQLTYGLRGDRSGRPLKRNAAVPLTGSTQSRPSSLGGAYRSAIEANVKEALDGVYKEKNLLVGFEATVAPHAHLVNGPAGSYLIHLHAAASHGQVGMLWKLEDNLRVSEGWAEGRPLPLRAFVRLDGLIRTENSAMLRDLAQKAVSEHANELQTEIDFRNTHHASLTGEPQQILGLSGTPGEEDIWVMEPQWESDGTWLDRFGIIYLRVDHFSSWPNPFAFRAPLKHLDDQARQGVLNLVKRQIEIRYITGLHHGHQAGELEALYRSLTYHWDLPGVGDAIFQWRVTEPELFKKFIEILVRQWRPNHLRIQMVLAMHFADYTSQIRSCLRSYIAQLRTENPTDYPMAWLSKVAIDLAAWLKKRKRDAPRFAAAPAEKMVHKSSLLNEHKVRIKEHLTTNDNVLKKLSPREEKIVVLRLGLRGEQRKTLEEIGELYVLTRERVRQIESKAIRKIKHIVAVPKPPKKSDLKFRSPAIVAVFAAWMMAHVNETTLVDWPSAIRWFDYTIMIPLIVVISLVVLVIAIRNATPARQDAMDDDRWRTNPEIRFLKFSLIASGSLMVPLAVLIGYESLIHRSMDWLMFSAFLTCSSLIWAAVGRYRKVKKRLTNTLSKPSTADTEPSATARAA